MYYRAYYVFVRLFVLFDLVFLSEKKLTYLKFHAKNTFLRV